MDTHNEREGVRVSTGKDHCASAGTKGMTSSSTYSDREIKIAKNRHTERAEEEQDQRGEHVRMNRMNAGQTKMAIQS